MSDLESQIPALIDNLAQHGWVVVDNFLTETEARLLRKVAINRLEAGKFHRAAVGRQDNQAIRDEIRGDHVLWLDPTNASTVENEYWQKIEFLRAQINRELFMGIREGEFHFSHYPIGSFYKRHLDCFRGDDTRLLSLICYLNEDWQDDNGGELELWLDESEQSDSRLISPVLGRLVLFQSSQFWHQVLPTRFERWSITGWMRR